MALNIPTESQEQQALFRWAAYAACKYPELALMYHVPNEGKRTMVTGHRMRTEGMKSGVPDICLPVARGGYHALYIEMKRTQRGKLSESQRWWLDKLTAQNNKAIMCKGWEAARMAIEEYLNMD